MPRFEIEVHLQRSNPRSPSSQNSYSQSSYSQSSNPQSSDSQSLDSQSPDSQKAGSEHSRYVQMLLHQDEIPLLHNILAAVLVWLLLAGFLVFPGTFTSLQKSVEGHDSNTLGDQAAKLIVRSIKNIPLLYMAAIMCGISVFGMLYLAFRHARNYVWLVNKLFKPGMTNSLAGLVSTLIGVYSQQHGTWSITAKITAMVEGASLFVCLSLVLLYRLAFLKQIKARHGEHYGGCPGQQRYSKQLFPQRA
ncbi:uncharacterized protein TrAtP1_003668 [Trichoderma atroviride]|uniref:uncharacterized protein n=1 Tax=Hypocrea atroviridis TaxID=63577 RepID=UPI00331D524D|nr:hypothetical protein TrAtP1_003668 [Trichoderma atroviride]